MNVRYDEEEGKSRKDDERAPWVEPGNGWVITGMDP